MNPRLPTTRNIKVRSLVKFLLCILLCGSDGSYVSSELRMMHTVDNLLLLVLLILCMLDCVRVLPVAL